MKKGTTIHQLIQVCWTMAAPATKGRDLRTLVNAMRALDTQNAIIATEEEEGEEAVKGERIPVVPLWKWLLETPVDSARVPESD